MGDDDDIYREADNETIENFMCAGTEALAARVLADIDPVLAAFCLKCAKEDWAFAYETRAKSDFSKVDDPNRIYTYLLKYSAATWSAGDLYETTGDDYYKEMAILCGEEVLACQQHDMTDWDIPYAGFFYDDPSKKLIAHYSHRSHENEPVKALVRLAELFPDSKRHTAWTKAIDLYRDYITRATESTAPYMVAPASIYHEDEAFDHCGPLEDGGFKMGMIGKYLVDDERKDNYRLQVQEGVPLGKGYYIRRMPVAFEHRGNHAITLATGKAMSEIARLNNDVALSQLAQRQLEWIVGVNPFAESVMFGEGYDYCQEYAVLPGEAVGEMGVGFACLDEHDSPYWPQVNTCVYKEVWIKSVLHYLWLAADFCGGAYVEGFGSVEFVRQDTGEVYTSAPCPKTGWYEFELPPGVYSVRRNGKEEIKSFVPAKQYTI